MSTAMATAPAMAITTYHQCQEKAGGVSRSEGEHRRTERLVHSRFLETVEGYEIYMPTVLKCY